MARPWQMGLLVAVALAAIGLSIWALADNARLFVVTALNGITLAALYFLVASGFTLVFGLLRNVNLAHGSLYLVGAYIGWVVADKTDSWFVGVAAGFASTALFGLLLQVAVFRFMQGQEMRQTMTTIGLSIVLADIVLWIFGGEIYQFDPRASSRARPRCRWSTNTPPTASCCWPRRSSSASGSGSSSRAHASG